MSSEKKLLTIAIPTYNRPTYLKECLDHICSQITDEIKVVVRDNCSSTYNFYEFIAPYGKKYGVVAFQNKVNIGGDANIARLYEDCDTEWLWIIGDDDYIKEDAVNLAICTLRGQGTDIVYIKFNSKFEGRVVGIEGFSNAMKPSAAFGNSFFTSEFICNVKLLQNYTCWHYTYLSTRCAQILRVVKYLLEHEEGECFFLKDEVLCSHGGDITWSHMDLVKYQLLIYDIFRENKRIFKDNIFKDIAAYCLTYIDSSDTNWREKTYYYKMLLVKIGIINLLRYNFVQCARIPLRFLTNQKVYKILKKIVGR